MIHRSSRLAAALAAGAAITAGAQAPTVTYRSTFDGYQPFADQQLRSWKEVNDNVGRIGGWRAYAQEAQQQGEAKPAAAPASAPASAPGHPPGHKH